MTVLAIRPDRGELVDAGGLADAEFAARWRVNLLYLRSMVGPKILDGPTEQVLTVRVSDWRAKLGLTIEDVAVAARRVETPTVFGRLGWPEDLLREFSAAVARAIRERQARDETAAILEREREAREEAARDPEAAAATRAAVRAMLEQIGTPIGRGRDAGRTHRGMNDEQGDRKTAEEGAGREAVGAEARQGDRLQE